MWQECTACTVKIAISKSVPNVNKYLIAPVYITRKMFAICQDSHPSIIWVYAIGHHNKFWNSRLSFSVTSRIANYKKEKSGNRIFQCLALNTFL